MVRFQLYGDISQPSNLADLPQHGAGSRAGTVAAAMPRCARELAVLQIPTIHLR